PPCSVYPAPGGTTIIRTKPQPGNKPPSEAQQQRERFQEAVAYAKGAKEQAAYVEKAAGTERSAYNPSTGSPLAQDCAGQAWRRPIGCIHPKWWKWISRPGQAA
ncbi:MAG: hypothetical protein KKC71_01715, partial [Chloroflexi bacterium]|nr:hypothetical protein [Chloroflexota bacterium]